MKLWQIGCSRGANDKSREEEAHIYADVPIPASILLLGSGIFGLGGIRRRFGKK